MEEKPNKKNNIIMIVALVAVILFVGYFFLFSKDESATTSPVSKSSQEIIGNDLLSLILELKKIKLNTELFKSPTFSSLKDFGITLKDQPVGRQNPFSSESEDIFSVPTTTVPRR